MIRIPQTFSQKLRRGEKPVIYTVITTDKGSRAFAQDDLTGIFDEGSFIEASGRLKNISGLGRAIESITRDVIDNLQSVERNVITAVYDNSDYHFGKLIPKEPFLTKSFYVYMGFEMDLIDDHILWFTGKIIEIKITKNEFIVTAEEK